MIPKLQIPSPDITDLQNRTLLCIIHTNYFVENKQLYSAWCA